MARSRDSQNDSDEGAKTPDPETEDSPKGGAPDTVAGSDANDAADGTSIEDAEVLGETLPGGDTGQPASDDDAIEGADVAPGQGGEPESVSLDTTVPSDPAAETPPDPPEDPAETAIDGIGLPGTSAAEDPAPEPTRTRSLFDPAPEPAPEQPPRPAPTPAPSSGGLAVVPLVIGGLVAGLIGVIAARYIDAPQQAEGPTPAENAALIGSQSAALAALSGRLDSVAGQLDEIAGRDIEGEIAEATGAATQPLDAALADLGARLDGLSARIEEVSTRVEAVALRPQAPSVDPGEFDEALEAFRSEVNAAIAEATAEIEEARGEAERISEQAFAAEQAAVARAAWGEVQAAIEAGEPFAEPLALAREQLSTDIPEALGAAADDGIPTLGELQAAFPDAARAALDASIRSEMGEGAMDRLTAFLRVQTGVRSLAPRDGDDPDAVLSRAEAAVQNGDLESALAEIETLPETGRSELEDWVARARMRLDVLNAAETVGAAVNSN